MRSGRGARRLVRAARRQLQAAIEVRSPLEARRAVRSARRRETVLVKITATGERQEETITKLTSLAVAAGLALNVTEDRSRSGGPVIVLLSKQVRPSVLVKITATAERQVSLINRIASLAAEAGLDLDVTDSDWNPDGSVVLRMFRAEPVDRLPPVPPKPPRIGVREPRRPRPTAPGGAVALPMPAID